MKPLLAATLEDPSTLPYPVYVSAKYDGIRALKFEGQMVSRNLKPIRNKYIQECLKDVPAGLDGELVVGPPNEGLVFNRTSSGVMSAGGKPDFKYYVFDKWNSVANYAHRRAQLICMPDHKHIQVVHQHIARNVAEFLMLEEMLLEAGYEGVMARGVMSPYKFGRATHNEGIIWKFKRFTDGEATVLAVLEGERNMNAVKLDLLGYKERSTHKENMVPSGMVGTIKGCDLATGKYLDISPGKMDHDDRIKFMQNPKSIIGKIIKYKVFNYGSVSAPRFATFQGFRDKDDL